MTSTAMKHSFTLNWVLDAPPAEVFRAWTDPEHLGWFYNPDNPIPTEPIELDLRVGGAWRQLMVINRSTTYMTGGVYREIVPDEKLVLAGRAPRLRLSSTERLDDSPQVTVTLAEVDGRTEMSVHVELPANMPRDVVPSEADRVQECCAIYDPAWAVPLRRQPPKRRTPRDGTVYQVVPRRIDRKRANGE